MEIITKKLSDLKPSPYNPRVDLKPGDPDYEKLKKSIQEFDYIDPIIWNKRSGQVVGGHQRLKVMQDLGYTEVKVSVVDLPDAKEKALNVALNKIGGNWDFSKLSDLLSEIDGSTLELDLTGFDDGSFKRILSERDERNLRDQISKEEDFTKAEDLAQKIINQVTAHVKHISRTSPEDLNNAIMVIVNKGPGNNVFFLADSSTKDLIQELKRYADAGGKSPLEMLTGAIWK